jgi:tRNA G46 methylase TrmB
MINNGSVERSSTSDGGCSDDQYQGLQYEARKPKWWTKLSGRRGTKCQRQTIERMTLCGYCFSKEVLSNFSRVNNSAEHSKTAGYNMIEQRDSTSTTATDQWRREWWNRSLGVCTEGDIAANVLPVIDTVTNSRNQKHAQKIDLMYNNKSPLQPRHFKQIWLELGFGNGDNILANSKREPDILYIGSEIHQPGIGAVLQKMETEIGLRRLVTTGEMEGMKAESSDCVPNKTQYQNIRIIPGDGIKLLSHLPCQYLDTILVTFPDPWPKAGHVHWRVVQPNVLKQMHRVLKSDGRVFIATDAVCFDQWTRKIFEQESSRGGWQEMTPCPDRIIWLPVVSNYEQKGINEGRNTMMQCWKKNSI